MALACVVTVSRPDVFSEAYECGALAHGDIGLTPRQFADRLHSILCRQCGAHAADATVRRFVASLHLTDLFLATGCAEGHEPAWARFVASYRQYLIDEARPLCGRQFTSVDVAADVIADLYLPNRAGTTRIASFEGRSALRTWLRTVVRRTALNARRAMKAVVATEPLVDVEDAMARSSVEQSLRSREYGDTIRRALTAACEQLTPRQRGMLLAHYQRGDSLVAIARRSGVHPSTTVRRFDHAHRALRQAIADNLKTLHVSDDCIAECLEELRTSARYTITLYLERGGSAIY